MKLLFALLAVAFLRILAYTYPVIIAILTGQIWYLALYLIQPLTNIICALLVSLICAIFDKFS